MLVEEVALRDDASVEQELDWMRGRNGGRNECRRLSNLE